MTGHRLAAPPLAVVGTHVPAGAPGEITELAVIHIDGGLTNGQPLTWWVQPAGSPVVPWSARPPMLPVPPDWSEIADRIEDELAGRVVVVHDAVRYGLLRRHLPRWRPLGVVLTQDLARQVWPDLATPDIGQVCRRAQCSAVQAERTGAIAEAQTLVLLLPRLVAAGARLPNIPTG